MISVKNKEPQIYYGSKTIKEVYKGSTKIYPSIDQQAIMDSLVCWYDPGKQQCTNESMAANPVLTDLSGNGHDIECFNFGWSGMSGIGGYVYDLIGSEYSTVSNNIATIISNEGAVGGNIITAPKQITGEKGKTLTYTRKAFDIKISNLPVGVDIQVNLCKNNGNTTKWEEIGYFVNGISHIDEKVFIVEPYDSESTPYIIDCRILFSNKLASVENIADLGITIEILPEYPNALVSDGVDDYAQVTGLPLLTKERGYTVIAKREYIATKEGSFAHKATRSTNDTSFICETYNDKSYQSSSFGGNNIKIENLPESIMYQTSTNYNGHLPLLPGDKTDSPYLYLFTNNNNNAYSCCSLYSFLLFDKDLTTAEIEWVKKNMIESGGVLKTDWSDSSLWAFYNEDNQSRINGTFSSNRMVITANGRSTATGPTAKFMEVIIENPMVPAYKIKVTGLKNGIVLSYIDGTINIRISEDGIYSIPEHNTQNRYFGYSFNKAFENENIVIQQLLS